MDAEKIIGLAVSGGADSLALMALVADWARAQARPRVIVYTLDHRLRPEAVAETQMVAQVARDFGLGCRILTWDAPKPRTGLQAAARAARYRLIGEAMAEDGASVLLTAHHRDDQAETVLMRLAHGSGVSGLKAMTPMGQVEGVKVFRPLLDVPRETLVKIVTEAGLTPVQDLSNEDTRYERVRWRKALPLLDDLGLSASRLAGLAHRLARVDDMAEADCTRFILDHSRIDDFGVVHIDREAFSSAHAEIGVRVIRRAVAAAGGRREAPLAPVEAVADALRTGAAFRRAVAGAIVAVGAHRIVIYRQAGRIAPDAVAIPIDRPLVWDGRFIIRAARQGVTVAPALGMTRAGYRALFAKVPDDPVAALRAAPLVREDDGTVSALGTRSLAAGIEVTHIALTG